MWVRENLEQHTGKHWVSTGVNKCGNKLKWISGCWDFLCLFSHQVNYFTHFTGAQTELLNLSLCVKECTNLQPWNGCDRLWVKVHISFILGKILMAEVECCLGYFVYTHIFLEALDWNIAQGQADQIKYLVCFMAEKTSNSRIWQSFVDWHQMSVCIPWYFVPQK